MKLKFSTLFLERLLYSNQIFRQQKIDDALINEVRGLKNKLPNSVGDSYYSLNIFLAIKH